MGRNRTDRWTLLSTWAPASNLHDVAPGRTAALGAPPDPTCLQKARDIRGRHMFDSEVIILQCEYTYISSSTSSDCGQRMDRR